MRIWLIAAALGIVLQAHMPQLPPPFAAAGLLGLALAASIWMRRGVTRALISGLAFGLAWGVLAGHRIHSGIIESRYERRDILIEGHVVGLPILRHLEERDEDVQRFDFRVDSARDVDSGAALPLRKLRLSWYRLPMPLKAGQRWRLTVRLKRPRDFWNPGGGDRVATMLSAGIGAVGYVRDRAGRDIVERLPGHDWRSSHHRLREHFLERLNGIHRGPRVALIAALGIGDRRGLDMDTRDLLRRTGVAHLLAVSGLHIGLATALFYFLGMRLAQGLLLPLRWWPAPIWGAALATFGATFYALMAGFGLPTRRALIMSLVVMAALLLRRRLRFSSGYCLALFATLMLEPLASFSAGFWLSFVAAGALMLMFGAERGGHSAFEEERGVAFGFRRLARRIGRGARGVLLAQLAVTLALLIPLGFFFGEVPTVSPLANLFAIPWVSLIVAPMTLGGVFLAPIFESPAGFLLSIAAAALEVLFAALEWLDRLPLPPWRPPPWGALSILCAASGIWAWLGLRARWRHFALLALAPLLLSNVAERGGSDSPLRMSVFDVGQGTSVLIRTPSRSLLYDAGARFGRSDAARLAILPALRRLGVRRLDRLLLSHGDLDHIGGLDSLLGAIPVDNMMRSPSPRATPSYAAVDIHRTPCVAGVEWRWERVRFRVLHPPADLPQRNENNRSCVLLIDVDGVSALLPGDIEADVERALLPALRRALGGRRLDILLASHHGSATSSAEEFVRALRPRFVVYSTGRLNRYGHPHPDVRARFAAAGGVELDTASGGALHFQVSGDGILDPPSLERALRRRHWNAPPPRARFPANIRLMK